MTAKSQLGIAEESVFGTYVAPTRFHEFMSSPIEYERERITSQAWRAGQRTVSAVRTKQGRVTGGGTVPMEVANKGFGLWFKHLFGAVATTTPGGGTLSRDHTFTLGDLVGKSLAVQVGVEDRGGTARPLSFLGCKVALGTFRCAVGGLLEFEPEIIIRDLDTAQTLGVATYPSGMELFSFVEGSITVGGVATAINQCEFTVDNALNTDDFAFGSPLRRAVPEPAIRPILGSVDADFVDLVAFNRFKNNTEAAIVLLFEGSTIEGALKYKVEITMPSCFTLGDTPKVEGVEEARQPLRFQAFAPAAGEPITLVYRTTDVAP